MKKKLSLIALSLTLVVSLSSALVYALPNDTIESEEVVVHSILDAIENDKDNSETVVPVLSIIEVKLNDDGEDETTVLAFSEDGKTALFDLESPEYLAFQSAAIKSMKKQVKVGLDLCMTNNVTLDHVRLDEWGEFISRYSGKTVNMFPTGNIKIACEGYAFELKNTQASRVYVKETLLPTLKDAVLEVAKEYPLYKYALDVKSGSLLKDYEFDINAIRIVDTVYPLDGIKDLYTYNTGVYYGLSLGEEYTSVLRGYVEGKDGYMRSVKGSNPGCVDVRASVVLLKDVSGLSLSNKSSAAYDGYNDLAVNLSTKELVDLRNISTDTVLGYGDYSLNPDNLIIVPTTDSVVVLQPTYLECFRYNSNNFTLNAAMGRVLDCTTFATTDEPVLIVSDTGEKIDLEKFVNENGIIGTELGKAPFLVYYNPNNLDYKRIVEWMYSKDTTINSTNRDALLSSLKAKFKAEGNINELNSYLKSVGQMTDNTKSLIFLITIIVIAVIVIVILIISKIKPKKTNVQRNTSGDLLFEDEDVNLFNEDDDDNEDNFEFQ